MSARFSLGLFLILLLLSLSLSVPAALDISLPTKKDSPSPAAPEPKIVSLQSPSIKPSLALTELTKQTGIHVEFITGISDAPIRLDLKNVTFWQALDAIAAACDARVDLYPTSGRILLARRGATYRLPPISYDGRFRLCVKKVTVLRDLEIRDDDPAHGACNLAVEVAWDPELQPLYLETRPHAVRLIDEKDQAIAVPDEGSSLAPVDGLIALVLDLRLPALPRRIATIRSLEGKLSMIGPSKMLSFTFDTLDRLSRATVNDPERRLTQEGVTCHISRVFLDRDRWTIQVTIDYPPGMKQLDSNQSWVVNNEMVLESLDGKKRFANSGYVLETATPRQAVLSYHFLDKGAMVRGKASDWKVIYRTPANLLDVPIRFAFKDIPLP